MEKMIGNFVAAFFLIVISVYIYYETSTYPKLGMTGMPGPETFPRLLAFMFIILSGVLIYQGIKSKVSSRTNRTRVNIKDKGFQRIICVLGITVAYMLALPHMGFLITTSSYLIILFVILGVKAPQALPRFVEKIPRGLLSPLMIVIISIGVSYAIYGVFQIFLKIPLP